MANVSKGLGFWSTTLSAVLATVVGGVILWVVLLFWPAADATKWVKGAAAWLGSGLWSALSFSMPVPVSVVVAVVLLWFWRSRASAATVPFAFSELPAEEFSAEELSIVKALGSMEGQPVYIEVAREALNIGPLEADRAVERLCRRELADVDQTFRGPTLRLTGKGRDLVLERQLKGDEVLRAQLAKLVREKTDGVRYLTPEETRKIEAAALPLRRGRVAKEAEVDLDEAAEATLLDVADHEWTEAPDVALRRKIGTQLALHHLEKLKASGLLSDSVTAGTDWGRSRHEWCVNERGRAYLARRNLLR